MQSLRVAVDFSSRADSDNMDCVLKAISRRTTGLISAALLVTALLGWPSAMSVAQPPPGEATVEPTLGPLFRAGLDHPHNCSASVLASASHDLVITAAHCLVGSGAGVEFVPGYRDGNAPYGVWTASQAYVDPSWTASQDPRHDVAILKVQRQQRGGRWVGVQDVVGANRLGPAPADGASVRVPAYAMGLGDEPIGCQSSLYRTGGYPGFDCPGYVGGTSGAPFLLSAAPATSTATDGGVVVGVIGGLHQGGCSDDTSYSAPFGPAVNSLLQRATAGLTPDVLPPAGSSGC
jgi:Trypsin